MIDGWESVEWRLVGSESDTHIRQMRSPFYSGKKFCVRRSGMVMNKDGNWEWEPMPSSRDDAFYARCRFDSFEEAADTLGLAASQRAGGTK